MIELKRTVSIDLVRGGIMILMLLDHTRTVWNEGAGIDPLDLVTTTPWLFGTRWITHLCAPLFVLLTGLSAAISARRHGRTPVQRCTSLLLRGLELMALEVLVTSAMWGAVAFLNGILFQVIWAIGLSLVLLSFLQFLPSRWVGFVGVVLIGAHNLIPDLAGLPPVGQLLWNWFHQHGTVALSANYQLVVLYPVVPWVAVMALGWSLAEVFDEQFKGRRRGFWWAGFVLLVLYALIRWLNGYGDPHPWAVQKDSLFTALSFFNVEKYPPSLDYLLVTLGLGFLALALLDTAKVKPRNLFVVLGRTPLFFYLIHLPFLIVTVVGWWLIAGAEIPFHYPLELTYALWLALLAPLYFACRWYGTLKFGPQAPAWTKWL